MWQALLTLSKAEILKGKKNFEELIHKGTSFYVFPFRVVFMLSANEAEIEDKNETKATLCVRLGISVPKKKFGSAVDRNKIKRQLREAYRLNKETLLYPILCKKNFRLNLLLIYTHNLILDTQTVALKTVNVLKKLEHEFISPL